MLDEIPAWMRFVLSCLATWRLTHFIVSEDGPWDVVVRMRSALGDSAAGRSMDCFYCSSVWLALPFAFLTGHDVLGLLVSWLALSGAASLLEQATNKEINNEHPPSRPGRKD